MQDARTVGAIDEYYEVRDDAANTKNNSYEGHWHEN